MSSRSLIVATLLFITKPVLAQDYEIRLHRPSRAGEKARVIVTGKDSQHSSASTGGRKVREETKEFAVELDAVCTILNVSSNGKASRLSVQLNKLVKVEAGARKEILPRDTIVVASSAGRKTVFEVDGRAVDAEAAQVLGVAITVGNESVVSNDDELFGTRERKRVGDTWEPNRAALERLFNNGSPMAARDITGKVTLKEVMKDSTGERLLVAMETTAKVGAATPPRGVTSQEGTMVMNGTREYPADPNSSLGQTRETLEMNISSVMVGRPIPNGPEMEMRLTASRSRTATATETR